MTIHTTDFQRQVELEIDMSNLGAARFNQRIAKEIEGDRGGESRAAQWLIKRDVGAVSEALRLFVEEVYSGRPGPKAVAAKLVRDMDPDVVAYIAIKSCLGRLMSKTITPLINLSLHIAQALESEARFERFAVLNPGMFARLDKSLNDEGANEAHKRKVLIYAMGKYNIPWDRWTRADQVLLGSKMIELVANSTGLIEMSLNQTAFSGQYKDQHQVFLTEKASEWIDKSMMRGEMMYPFYMPTVIPPKAWTGLVGGGYHSDAVRPLDLVRRARKEHRALLEAGDLSKVLRGLNAIQDTPWQVNRQILDTMQQLLKASSTVAGMVPLDEMPLPPKPYDIDTNEVSRQEWKWAARDVHNANYRRRQDRLTQHGLLQLSERFKDEAAIYFPHNLDFRGRAYPVPLILNPQGSDNVKALQRFAVGKPLGDDGERWLAIHGANCFGVDKVPFEDRVKWVEEHTSQIVRSALNPVNDLWWTEADKPWCFLAFCFEWADMLQCRVDGREFLQHLPIAQDGSCNGLQHFSAMLLDEVGGTAVNLVPSSSPQDIYRAVADQVMGKLKLFSRGSDEEKARWAYAWRHLGVDRKVTKRPVMVLPYGGTPRSCLKYVEEAVMEKIGKGGHNFGDELKRAVSWLSSLVWESIGDVVVAAKDAMGWLQKTARVTAKHNKPLHWETPSGFVAYQLYPELKHKLIKTRINGSIIRLSHYEELETVNGSKQATSISPNYVHSMDAAAMILTAAELADAGVTNLAMIHDSYGTHACDTTLLSTVLRRVFVDMYLKRPLQRLREEIIDQCSEAADDIPELPEDGTLDLKRVMHSDFFFA